MPFSYLFRKNYVKNKILYYLNIKKYYKKKSLAVTCVHFVTKNIYICDTCINRMQVYRNGNRSRKKARHKFYSTDPV